MYIMGAGILPTTIHNGKLYFLFGKENKYETSAPGFSDFGGGTDNNETFFTTAVREAGEELTGFLGSSTEVRHMLRKFGTYHIDYEQNGHKAYRMHIFPYDYNEWLPYYYNNNQQFLQKHLSSDIFQTYKIFENHARKVEEEMAAANVKPKIVLTKKCPSCATEIPSDVKNCPICKHIFEKLRKKHFR